MIVFSDHANERNLVRKIPKNQIISTVKKPDEVIDSFKGRKLNRKKFARKILEVITITEANKTIVITQYYLEEENES